MAVTDVTAEEVALALGLDEESSPVAVDEAPVEPVDTPSEEPQDDPPEPEAELPEPTDHIEDTPPEDDSEGDEPAALSSDEGSWKQDAEILALAGSYGMKPEELDDFGTAEEFSQAAIRADRILARQGAAAPPLTLPEAHKPAETKPIEMQPLDIAALEEAGHDETTIALARQVNQLQEARQADQARLEEASSLVGTLDVLTKRQSAVEENTRFHDVLDKMDASRYGRSVDENGSPRNVNQLQNQARAAIWEARDQMKRGIVARAAAAGVQPQLPPDEVLIQRAERMLFGDDLVQQGRQQERAAIREQSKRRRPVGRTNKPRVTSAHDGDPLRAILEDEGLAAQYDQFQEENGVR